MNRHNLHVYCNTMTEQQVQNFGVSFGAWVYGLNRHMNIGDLYSEGEAYLKIDPQVQLDYRQKATFHASVLCGYEEKRLGR